MREASEWTHLPGQASTSAVCVTEPNRPAKKRKKRLFWMREASEWTHLPGQASTSAVCVTKLSKPAKKKRGYFG
jgi:hypothetical protein